MVIILVGGQWGDEGKGKVIDYLASKAQMVIRTQGGNNAGHTVVTEHGEFKFQLMPSGILYPHCTCVIGNGVVVDPQALLAEVDELAAHGIDAGARLVVSDKAHLILPYHRDLDLLNVETGEIRSVLRPATACDRNTCSKPSWPTRGASSRTCMPRFSGLPSSSGPTAAIITK